MSVIRRAIETLPGHWYQGGLEDKQGNACGIGHCLNAALELGNDNSSKFMDVIALEQFPDRISSERTLTVFAQFNDHPDTTEEEVLMVMEKAAIRFEEQVQ